MGLQSVIAKGVAIANRVTSTLQVEVEHRAWVGQDNYTQPVYSHRTIRTALWEQKEKAVRTAR